MSIFSDDELNQLENKMQQREINKQATIQKHENILQYIGECIVEFPTAARKMRTPIQYIEVGRNHLGYKYVEGWIIYGTAHHSTYKLWISVDGIYYVKKNKFSFNEFANILYNKYYGIDDGYLFDKYLYQGVSNFEEIKKRIKQYFHEALIGNTLL